MASGVVKVGRRTYAVGLIWQPSPSGRVAQAAREAAQQPGQKSDFYCVRPATKTVSVPQYGLGQSSTGHKTGMPTLAASLANGQPGSWTGAFRLREGTWVVVVRDDLIAPDGDILFDNDDLARDRLLQEVSLGGMQRIYAPDGWAVPGSDPTPLPLLLQDRLDCRLQPVHLPMRLIIYGAGAVAIVVVLIFLALQWQADQEKAEAERLRLEKIARENILRQQGAVTRAMEKFEWPPADQLYEHKWEKEPLPGQAVENCKNLFAKIAAAQIGWNRGTVECKGGMLSIQWNRDKKEYGLVPEHANVKDDLSSAVQRIPGDKPTARGPETLLQEINITTRALNQNWPVNMTRLPDDPAPPPPPNVKDPPPPPPPPWRKRGIRYNGKAPPWEVWKYFDGVPGMIIEKITWEGSNWIMEATIYEMRGGA